MGSATLADSDDGNVRFVIGAGSLKGTATSGGIVQVDGETGRPGWGRRQAGYALGGGGLSDQFLLTHIPNDKAPRVAAVNTSNGDLAWCTKLGTDVETGWQPTFDSATKGNALFTVRGSDSGETSDRDVRLSRLDTGSGDVTWDVPVKGVIQADSLHLLGDQVLLSPLHTDMEDQDRATILTQEHDQPVRDRGALVALSVADGAASWTYRGPDERPWVNNVVGAGKDVAVVISRRPVKDGNKPWTTETWMVGLDRTGKQLWKYDFKNQYDYDLSRWSWWPMISSCTGEGRRAEHVATGGAGTGHWRRALADPARKRPPAAGIERFQHPRTQSARCLFRRRADRHRPRDRCPQQPATRRETSDRSTTSSATAEPSRSTPTASSSPSTERSEPSRSRKGVESLAE